MARGSRLKFPVSGVFEGWQVLSGEEIYWCPTGLTRKQKIMNQLYPTDFHDEHRYQDTSSGLWAHRWRPQVYPKRKIRGVEVPKQTARWILCLSFERFKNWGKLVHFFSSPIPYVRHQRSKPQTLILKVRRPAVCLIPTITKPKVCSSWNNVDLNRLNNLINSLGRTFKRGRWSITTKSRRWTYCWRRQR